MGNKVLELPGNWVGTKNNLKYSAQVTARRKPLQCTSMAGVSSQPWPQKRRLISPGISRTPQVPYLPAKVHERARVLAKALSFPVPHLSLVLRSFKALSSFQFQGVSALQHPGSSEGPVFSKPGKQCPENFFFANLPKHVASIVRKHFINFCQLDKALSNLTQAGPDDFQRSFPTWITRWLSFKFMGWFQLEKYTEDWTCWFGHSFGLWSQPSVKAKWNRIINK